MTGIQSTDVAISAKTESQASPIAASASSLAILSDCRNVSDISLPNFSGLSRTIQGVDIWNYATSRSFSITGLKYTGAGSFGYVDCGLESLTLPLMMHLNGTFVHSLPDLISMGELEITTAEARWIQLELDLFLGDCHISSAQSAYGRVGLLDRSGKAIPECRTHKKIFALNSSARHQHSKSTQTRQAPLECGSKKHVLKPQEYFHTTPFGSTAVTVTRVEDITTSGIKAFATSICVAYVPKVGTACAQDAFASFIHVLPFTIPCDIHATPTEGSIASLEWRRKHNNCLYVRK